MKAIKRILYAHWSVWMPLAKEVLGSQMVPGCCQSPPHKGLWEGALWPPQKVMRMLKSVKHLFCAYNLEEKVTFQPSFPSNYQCRAHLPAVPEPGAQLSSRAERRRKRRRSWGLLKVVVAGEAALSQALTHLPEAPGCLKHRELPA